MNRDLYPALIPGWMDGGFPGDPKSGGTAAGGMRKFRRGVIPALRPHARLKPPGGHRSPSVRRPSAGLVLLVLVAALASCRDKSVTSYRIPKDADSAPPAPAADAAPASAPGLSWTAPESWQAQAATGMRQASFLVSSAGGAPADVSVVSFPGAGGDDLANVNRWRGQLKLAPISADDPGGQMQALRTPAGEFAIADILGAPGEKGVERILGAWLRLPDRVWFFKMMGPSELVETQKDPFLAFLHSVTRREGSPGGPALAPIGPGPSNTNDLPRADSQGEPLLVPPAATDPGLGAIPVQTERGESLLWTAPAAWKTQVGRAMRKASFATEGGAEVAITAFPGDVGGVLANVNRWREQAGLEPVDPAGLGQATSSFDSNGLHFIVTDASAGPRPIIAALAPWNGGTWFFKLTGPSEAVTRDKPAFLSFLKTVRRP
jgi:hypothetical protein